MLVHSLVVLTLGCAAASSADAGLVDAGSVSVDAGANPDADLPWLRDAGPIVLPPPPEDWEPPFPLGAPGWRESEDTYCPEFSGALSTLALFVDERGVFALNAVRNNAFDSRHPRLPDGRSLPNGYTLMHHDGTGWESWLAKPSELMRPPALYGVPGGPMMLHEAECPLTAISGPGASVCSLDWRDGATVAGVSAQSAYALVPATAPWYARDILHWNGTGWRWVAAGPASAGSILANERGWWTTSEWGGIHGEDTEPLEGIPEGPYTVIGLHGEGFAIGFAGQMLLGDEGGWREVALPEEVASVSALWSDGTTLYITGGRVFGRIGPSDAVEVLAAWENPDQWIRAIHGHPSTGEVFLAIEDESLWGHACGAGIIVRYDGAEFHRI